MSKADTRMVNGTYEFFDENNRQISVRGELIALTYEDGKALTQALCDETDYLDRYENTDENLDILIRVAKKLNRYQVLPDALTKSRLLAAYAVANAAGGACGDCGTLERVAAEPEAAPAPVARDEAGRFQNQLLHEYHEMLANPQIAAAEISKRLRTDRAFREAVESEARVKPQRRTEEQVIESEIGTSREFADAFRRAPAPKFLNGRVTIGLQDYTPVELDAAIEKASRLGLL